VQPKKREFALPVRKKLHSEKDVTVEMVADNVRNLVQFCRSYKTNAEVTNKTIQMTDARIEKKKVN
jgi:hypothetical protein